MLKYKSVLQLISNHPFIFLLGIAILASCCFGGAAIVFNIRTPEQTNNISPSVTATAYSTDIPLAVVSDTPTTAVSITSASTQTDTSEASVVTTLEAATASISFVPSPTVTIAPSLAVSQVPTVSQSPLIVTFIDVGQGDSILIQSPSGQIALIDGGSADSGVVPYLQNHGIRQIDIIIASHPHEDHIGGLVQVLEEIPVTEVVTNGQMHTTSVYENFLDAIDNAQAEYVEVVRGDVINIGDIAFSVLSPSVVSGDDLNHNSLVLRLPYQNTAFLFMGDADMEAEAGILASGLPIQADILKVGHHGSCSSSSPSFLRAAGPEVAIYSAGINNKYNHPCADTIRNLSEQGILVLGTDLDGTIIVTVSEDGYSITNSAGQRIR